MSKFFKLENYDCMDVWVIRADIVKVDVTSVDEDDNEESFAVYVYKKCDDKEISYPMRGPIGAAAALVDKLEVLEKQGYWGWSVSTNNDPDLKSGS